MRRRLAVLEDELLNAQALRAEEDQIDSNRQEKCSPHDGFSGRSSVGGHRRSGCRTYHPLKSLIDLERRLTTATRPKRPTNRLPRGADRSGCPFLPGYRGPLKGSVCVAAGHLAVAISQARSAGALAGRAIAAATALFRSARTRRREDVAREECAGYGNQDHRVAGVNLGPGPDRCKTWSQTRLSACRAGLIIPQTRYRGSERHYRSPRTEWSSIAGKTENLVCRRRR